MFLLQILAFEAVIAGLLFGSAGRWDLPWFWALVAVHAPMMFVGAWAMGPDLRRERRRPGPGDRDRPYRKGLALGLIAHPVVAGLDARFGWSGGIPAALRATALVLYVAAIGFGDWALAANRFFSSVVRLQSDRGHRVVTDGPYRFVRHPGYASMLIAAACGAVVLGSWWSLLPLVPFAVVLVGRIRLEDRFLHESLPGYVDYAAGVRYRLVPGVW